MPEFLVYIFTSGKSEKCEIHIYYPLLVGTIFSGNGLFLQGIASIRKDANFLSLEINKKILHSNRCNFAIRAIVSSYPGLLVLVSIQVFLQSDVEAVAIRMGEQFLKAGEGKLIVAHGGWLRHNPFGVQSDWERHVVTRGDPMYRLMLVKL